MAEPGSRNKLSKRKLDKYLKNRDFAELVEHGRKIAAAIGHPVEADAFNPVIVDFYQTVGYLPEAIINYLALLGWSLDDKTRAFFAAGVDREVFAGAGEQGPGQFRPARSSWRSRTGISSSSRLEQKVGIGRAVSGKGRARCQSPPTAEQRQIVEKVVAAAGDRIKVAGDILASPISSSPTTNWFTTKRPSKSISAQGRRGANCWRSSAIGWPPSSRSTRRRSKGSMHDFVAAEGIKIGQIIHAVRVAVTGTVGRPGAVRHAGDPRTGAVLGADRAGTGKRLIMTPLATGVAAGSAGRATILLAMT